MENINIEKIAQKLGLKESQVSQVLDLTAEGNTIPFIARYRKEMTGNLDEVEIKAIIDLDKSMTALAERKATVLAKIEEQGKLTDALRSEIEAAEKLADVEELYLPYKEKRRTKATIAREAGLFPLARLILQDAANLQEEAEKLISEAFPTAEATLAGAVDILTEAISEDTKLRAWTYHEMQTNSSIVSSLKDGIFSLKGELLTPVQYKHLEYYWSGVLLAQKDSLWGFIGIDGKEKLAIIYDRIEKNDYGYTLIKGDKVGFFRYGGQYARFIPAVYTQIYFPSTSKAFAVVHSGDKLLLIDRKGVVHQAVPTKVKGIDIFLDKLEGVAEYQGQYYKPAPMTND